MLQTCALLFYFRFETDISGGDVFHLINIGPKDLTGVPAHQLSQSELFPNRVSDEFGILVVNPDVMVSPTRITEACACARRSVLSERVRSLSGTSSAAVIGNVKHSFIEVSIAHRQIFYTCSGFTVSHILGSHRHGDIANQQQSSTTDNKRRVANGKRVQLYVAIGDQREY